MLLGMLDRNLTLCGLNPSSLDLNLTSNLLNSTMDVLDLSSCELDQM